jgi:hypothetical protein
VASGLLTGNGIASATAIHCCPSCDDDDDDDDDDDNI